MRKSLLALAILAGFGLGAAPAPVASHTTPWGLLVEAGRLPAADSPRCTAMEYRDYPPYSKKWWDLAFESEQRNTEQFHLLRESRLLMQSNGGRSGIPTPAPTVASIKSFVAFVDPQRNLANIVSDGAIFSHLSDHDAEAVGRVMDELNIADCLRQSHILFGPLVAAGLEMIGTYTVDIIAPALRLSGAPAADTRKQTIQLIHCLLDESPVRQGWQKAFAVELVDCEHPLAYPGVPTQVPITPAEIKHDLPLLDKACEFHNLPASLAIVKQCVWPAGPEFTGMDHWFIMQFRSLADRRMAAIDLAMQLYRADHGGNWPSRLDELVPKYLPAVPRDPFRTGNGAIGYKIIPKGWPDGKDRPVVFVEAGPDIHLASTPYLGWYSSGKHQVRQYRDLTLPTSKKF